MTVTPPSLDEWDGPRCDKCEELLESGDIVVQLETYYVEIDGKSWARDKMEGFHPIVHKDCLEESDVPEPVTEAELLQ